MHLQWIGVWASVGVAVAAAAMMLPYLGEAPLALYDEQTYVRVAMESIERDDFVTFTHYDNLWFEKPPLYFWFLYTSLSFCGPLDTASQECINAMGRLPSALAGVGVVVLVMLLAQLLTGSFVAAAVSGTILLLTPPFVEGARTVLLDIVVAFYILLALYAFWRALKEDTRWYWLFGAAVGLAVLAKSIIAVFALLGAGLIALWLRDASFLYSKRFWVGALIGVAVALPWHLALTLQHGGAFWQEYLGTHVVERYGENLFVDPGLQADYTLHLFVYAKVITALFLLAVVFLPRYWLLLDRPQKAALGAMLALTFGMLFVFYTAQTRAFSYLLPVYPVAALALGIASCAVHPSRAKVGHET